MGQVAVDRKTLVAGVVIALAAGTFLGFLLGKGSSTENQPAEGAPRSAGPTDELNGVPVGYARTEDGAVAAATEFSLISTGDLVGDGEALREAVETLAAPSWREEAMQQAQQGHEFAVEHYGPDVEMATAVLRYRLHAFNAQEASVSLWAVTIASGSKRPSPEAIWGTSRLDLEWVDGDWRLRGTENEVGPVPEALQPPTGEATIQSFLEEFRGFSEGPRP